MAQQILQEIAPDSPNETFDRINAAIRSLRAVVDTVEYIKAQQLTDEASVVALQQLSASINQAVTKLTGQRFDFLNLGSRTGDLSAGYTIVSSRAQLAGDGKTSPEISGSSIVVGDGGKVVRLTGPQILAHRGVVSIEPSRVFRARFVVQRRSNASDPSNDSVVLGIVWLDAGLTVLAPDNDVTIVEDIQDLTTAMGRQERSVVFSLSPSPDSQFRAPARARYARAYVQNYGLDGGTDVEILSIEDVSSATILAPETANTVERVTALESLNLGERLSALESNSNMPNSVTFATKSDAASGNIPNTVTTVAIRGIASPGDGGDGIYKKIAGPAPSGSDNFINQGVSFVRVYTSTDVLGALLLSLPTTPPSAAGKAWLNGGVLAVS